MKEVNLRLLKRVTKKAIGSSKKDGWLDMAKLNFQNIDISFTKSFLYKEG